MKQVKCYNCSGKMNEIKKQIKAGWGEYTLTIDGVKGFVCQACGAKMYAPDEIEMVENISKSIAESKQTEKPAYLNVDETADLLRVSNQTVYNMIKENKINAVKFGREWRFQRKAIESMMNSSYIFTPNDGGYASLHDQPAVYKSKKKMKKDEK
jgi:excisionase family DNA binding protein/YgiT-type zinc finger domain-containing protein